MQEGAAVYVLGPKGYEKAREGSNGFSCLVQRVRRVVSPVCYDAEGSRTTLLADFRREELKAAGMDETKVQEALAAEYEKGELKAPQRPGIAYMLSPDFYRVDPETREATRSFRPT